MKKEYGILVDHDFGVQVHRHDCKDFLNPNNHTSNHGSFAVKEQVRLPLGIDQTTDLNDSEELRKLVVTLSNNFWGGEGMLYDPTIYKCTGLVNRKTQTKLHYGFLDEDDYYDGSESYDYKIFRTLINFYLLNTNLDFKSEYYEGLPINDLGNWN
jgi:hypothetical protein